MHIGKATQSRKNNTNNNVMLQYVRDQSSVDEEVNKKNGNGSNQCKRQ